MEKDVNTTRVIRTLIDAEKPDFLAFSGDMVSGMCVYCNRGLTIQDTLGTDKLQIGTSLFGIVGPQLFTKRRFPTDTHLETTIARLI